MNDVVLISGGNSTQGLVPHLLKNKLDVAVLDPQSAQVASQKYGDRVIGVNWNLPEINQAAINESAKLVSIANESLLDAPDIDGDSSRFRNYLNSWLPGMTFLSFNNSIQRILALDRLIQTRNVVMVVTHEDVTETFGGMVRWAKDRDIPTMHVPHGNCYLLPEQSPDIHEQSICDYIAGTPFMVDFYTSRGFTGKTALTGSPIFDHWENYRADRAWAQKCLKVDPNKPMVCYASSWSQATNANDDQGRFEEVLRWVMTAGFEQLVIKLHPGEPRGIEENYVKMAQDFGCKCIVTRLYNELILSAADVMLALGPSNFTVDAALFNIPSVIVRMPGYSIQHTAIPEIEPDQIRDIDFNMVGETFSFHRDDFLKRNHYSYQASKNVAGWVAQLCGK